MAKWYLVSQNQSYQYEFAKQILWSPQRNRDGSQSNSYECMQNIKTGDIIINVHHQHIMGISIAISDSYAAAKPAEFHKYIWGQAGWQVDLKMHHLKIPLAPEREFFANPNHKRADHDAFNKHGNINQAYLFELSPSEISHIKDLVLAFLLDF
ncbi:hypothetical protein MOO44_00655 (plasmid) [Nicoliella spurrieriana]|uniref:Uncharacterized protein n=1 Tax=Nicoliella spurrieriana TaxID=2925830 RepID=A0A976RQZ0_9LACO|nr:hypothetical protein [Nicoliella spurrieriana]UQS86183.1 hypothetical protein MOO44_00655 [Nicoliella spurrieriana]